MRERRGHGRVEIHPERCQGCGLCVTVCPVGALALDGAVADSGARIARFRGSDCRADELCFHACPEPGALRVLRIAKV